jgi:hypothetical protein
MPAWDIKRRSSRASTATRDRDRDRFHADVPVRGLQSPNSFETKPRADIRKLLIEGKNQLNPRRCDPGAEARSASSGANKAE